LKLTCIKLIAWRNSLTGYETKFTGEYVLRSATEGDPHYAAMRRAYID